MRLQMDPRWRPGLPSQAVSTGPPAPPECPVDPDSQRWIESSLCWFADEFGTDILNRDVDLPTADSLTSDSARAVHELCQTRLSESRTGRNREAGERLPALLAVYSGLGILSANAGPGYLSPAEFGYALACYAWLRGERQPAWARHLSPGPGVVLERGLAYLAASAADGVLPTQHLLHKAVRIGSTTVRVTRGRTLRLGSLLLTLPDHTASRPRS